MQLRSVHLAGALLALATAVPSAAAPPAAAATIHRLPQGLAFELATAHAGASLTVTGPEGFLHQRRFGAGDDVRFDLASAMPDGLYRFELRLFPQLDAATRRALVAARGVGEEAAAATLRRLRAEGNVPPESEAVAGTFTVQHGSLVADDLVEPRQSATAAGSTPLQRAQGARGLESLGAADQILLDDVLVIGSLCAGLDCVNGEAFDQDVVRMKEVNTRLKFLDTSSGAFPSNDWQLTANDSTSGGANKFSIDDVTGSRVPFTIEAGSRTHSLYVDNTGRVGFGTGTPVEEAHFVAGDTPTLRLDQDGSGSFAAQVWDLGGNETNFFVRDVTNGSQFPFQIEPGASTGSLRIDSSGDIGVGTASPAAALHVVRGGSEEVRDLLHLTNNGRVRWRLQDTSADGQILTVRLAEGDLDFSFSGSAGDQVEMKSNGNMVIQGTLTQMSDRERKTGITPVVPEEILEKVDRLPISRWRQRDGDPEVEHLGPMAQDFHALFGLGDDNRHIATLDTSGVALAAIQALSRQLHEKQERIEQLEARLEALEALLAE